MSNKKLLRTIIFIAVSAVVLTVVVIIYSIRSTVYWGNQHEEAVIYTRQVVSTQVDSMLNELQSSARVNLSLQTSISDLVKENQHLKLDHQKDLEVKNKIIRQLNSEINNLLDSIRSIERSELEQRYRDQ